MVKIANAKRRGAKLRHCGTQIRLRNAVAEFQHAATGAGKNLPGARVREQGSGHHRQVIGQSAADFCPQPRQILGGADQILDLEAPSIEMQSEKPTRHGRECGGTVSARGYLGPRAGWEDDGARHTALRIQHHASAAAAKPSAGGQRDRQGEGPSHRSIYCRATT